MTFDNLAEHLAKGGVVAVAAEFEDTGYFLEVLVGELLIDRFQIGCLQLPELNLGNWAGVFSLCILCRAILLGDCLQTN